MGKKFVTVSETNVVQEVFDEANKNVPNGALEITDIEFQALSNRDRIFADFEIVGGALQLTSTADADTKTRKINNLITNPAFKAFAELMLDEINTLRTKAGLLPRTMGNFKTAMKSKLT